MGAYVHVMEAVDPESMTGVCRRCGPVSLKLRRKSNGDPRYSCRIGESERYNTPAAQARKARWNATHPKGSKGHRAFVAASCERCGFKPESVVQLDVHHVDLDHKNNVRENLRTLCANCHRLLHHRLREAENDESPASAKG